MRRTILQVFAGLAAAGIIGTALTVLLWDDDEPLAVGGSPSPAATASPTAPPLTLAPSPTATPTAAASATPTAAPATTAPSGPRPSARPASSVDCGATPQFCSSTTGTMEVRDDKLVASGTTRHQVDYSAVPDTTMTSTIVREGGGPANNGDDVQRLEVAVEIRNDTDDTFVIPDREVILVVMLDGEVLHELATEGEDFEMRPGGVLTARYDIPLAFDGKYSWRAKTSFYER